MNIPKNTLLRPALSVGLLIFLITTTAQAVTPACGTTLTTDTDLDSNMSCPSIALFLSGAGSNGVTLDCMGYSIETTEPGTRAIIEVDDTMGVRIANCNITTESDTPVGIRIHRSVGSTIEDSIITTNWRGIQLRQSSNNTIRNNTVSTQNESATGIEIEDNSSSNLVEDNMVTTAVSRGLRIRSSSDNNTLVRNRVESPESNAVRIESSSNNLLTENTFSSGLSYVRIRNLAHQNGGLSVDNSGYIWMVEANHGSSGPGGSVSTIIQVDPANIDERIFSLRLSMSLGGPDLGFGFDSLEITPNGRFLATRAGGSNSLYEIDSISGVVTEIDLILPVLDGGLNGLQVIDEDTLLASTNKGELLRIDLSTNPGTATRLGSSGIGWTDLAMDPATDRLYASTRWFSEATSTSHLYEINPLTGEIIGGEILDTGTAFLADMDFSSGGVLYSSDDLNTIDISTGLVTNIGGGYGPDPFEQLSENNVLESQTFTATTTASLTFLEPIDLPPSLELSLDASAIQLGFNSIFVDSALYPFLDVPARITFENLDGESRDILVDLNDDGTFETCGPPQCNFVSFEGGTLIFDVSGFTSYSSKIRYQSVESALNTVLGQIDALLNDPGISDKAKQKLEEAKKKLEMALEKLDKGDVKKGLKETGKAAKELLKVGKEGVDVTDLISPLVESVRREVQDAIDTAIANSGESEDIAKAQDELLKAQNELGKGNSDKAIKHYAHAWDKAQKAVI